jgi:hypothetical protein
VRVLALEGDGLLFSGGDDGRLIAWDVTGQKAVAELALKSAVHSIAIDAAVARGDHGALAVGTADGAVHVLKLAINNATPSLTATTRHALSDGRSRRSRTIRGLWVAGGADGQLRVIGECASAVTRRRRRCSRGRLPR